MEKVLFIVAHPDDAELAAGGSIKKFSSTEGSVVRVVNLTVSENTAETRQNRIQAAERAAGILHFELEWYNAGVHNQVEEISMHQLVRYTDALIRDFAPTLIFTHWHHDSHYDHVLTSKAVMASTRKWTGKGLYFLPPNELRTVHFTDFSPNAFIDISEHMDAKLEAISSYNSFQGNIFRPLNTEDFRIVNRYFGIAAGCTFAEAFIIRKQTQIFL